MTDASKPTIVLVHGAFADASGWSAVYRELAALGYPVYAPSNPLRGVVGDSQYIRSFVSSIVGPVVLAGHSYGGCVITNASDGVPAVKSLVYVAAFAPDEGETLSDALTLGNGSTDLAKRVGSDVPRLERTILRINTIESTSPMANLETVDSASLPAVLVPSEPLSPHRLFEQSEMRDRVREVLETLPVREQKIIRLYYFEEATMKQIGRAIGVNESRVSQLHARAVQRLRKALGADCPTESISPAVLSFQSTMRRLRMAKAEMPHEPGVVLQYRAPKPAQPKSAPKRKAAVRREPIAAAR